MKKQAIVFGGGGSKGSYELGVWEALEEMGIKADIVTGTSIGAMMATLYVQGSIKVAQDLWDNLLNERVMYLEGVQDIDVESMMNSPLEHKAELMSYIKSKGIQIDPLKGIVKDLYDPKAFFESTIDFGIVTTQILSKDAFFKQVNVTKDELTPENARDYILASASAFPIFPIYQIGEDSFVDGGYCDNIPVELAKKLGATHFITVDLNGEEHAPVQRENEIRIKPYQDLGPFLAFTQDKIQTNRKWGYLDTMKTFGKYFGYTYTFELEGEQFARAFDERIKSKFIETYPNKYKDYAYPSLHVSEQIAYDCGLDHLSIYKIEDFLIEVEKIADTTYQPLIKKLQENEFKTIVEDSKNKNMQFAIAYYIFDMMKTGGMPSWFEKVLPHIPSSTILTSLVLHEIHETNLGNLEDEETPLHLTLH